MPSSSAAAANGTLTMKTDDQSNHSSSSPPVSGPSPIPTAASAAQIAIAFARSLPVKTFAMIERVAGMISAAPTPIAARTRDHLVGRVGDEGAEAGEAEDRDAGLERALAPEAVAERAEHEQQPGEDEQVGVDHPLQLRRRGVELVLQRRQGDVEDRVVEPDDHQAQRQHAERLPAARVLDGIDGHQAALLSGGSRRGSRMASPEPRRAGRVRERVVEGGERVSARDVELEPLVDLGVSRPTTFMRPVALLQRSETTRPSFSRSASSLQVSCVTRCAHDSSFWIAAAWTGHGITHLADRDGRRALGDEERQQRERVLLARGVDRPPDRVAAGTAGGERALWRSGLSKPRKAAKATPHSFGSWWW